MEPLYNTGIINIINIVRINVHGEESGFFVIRGIDPNGIKLVNERLNGIVFSNSNTTFDAINSNSDVAGFNTEINELRISRSSSSLNDSSHIAEVAVCSSVSCQLVNKDIVFSFFSISSSSSCKDIEVS